MKLLCTIIMCLMIPFLSFGQDTDIDTGFNQARAKAEAKDYNSALKILNNLQKKYPANEDILVFQGRVYGWKRDFTKAKKALKPLADRPEPNMEAVEALVNTYYWSSDYKNSITYSDKYLEKQPNTENVLMIKAISLERTNRDEEALVILNSVKGREYQEQINGLKTAISRKKKNAISASYLNISTYDPGIAPVHYGYVEYLRKFTNNTVIARANVGYREGQTEGQLEVDYYHTFKKNYLYTNVGVSNTNIIFPKLRLGAEYYFAPAGKFDLSLGGRYMSFENDNVTLITGQATYNYKNYAFGYRPYYDIDNSLMSHVVSFQRTNEDKESLLRVELQYGNVPYLYLYNNFTEPLKAYRIGIQYQHRLAESFFVRPIFLYEYEEYLPGIMRNKYNCQVIFTKRF